MVEGVAGKMAEPGVFFDRALVVNSSRDLVMHSIKTCAVGEPHSQVTVHASGAITVSRRYRPDWAIVVAVLSAAMFAVTLWTVGHAVPFWLIGLPALLYKRTEILWLTVTPDGDRTRLTVCGTTSQTMLSRLFIATDSLAPVGTTAVNS